MEGLGFLYAVMPVLRKIYKGDDEALKAAMHHHIAAFNMTVAPSPFVMGTTIAMEEKAKRDKTFDVASINAIKVSLMGPLSGIGDTSLNETSDLKSHSVHGQCRGMTAK